MHFTQTATAVLGLAAGLASAVDIRFYFTDNCSSNFVVCQNIGANVCCRGSAVSMFFAVDRTIEARGFDQGACARVRTITPSTTSFCMRPGGFVYTGGMWRPPPSLRLASLPEPAQCKADEKCDSVQKPGVLSLADGSEWSLDGLDDAKYDKFLALAAEGGVSSAKDVPAEFKDRQVVGK